MYPWDVLGIEETDDKKVIKKAYAKLIRQYRPDEAPEKFQEINQAYQYALKFKKQTKAADTVAKSASSLTQNIHQHNVDTTSVNSELSQETSKVRSDSGYLDEHEVDVTSEVKYESIEVESQLTELLPEVDDLSNDDQQIAAALFAQTHLMVFDTIYNKLDKGNWSFLAQFHDIQGFEIRDEVAKKMFYKVAEYNFFQLKQNKILLIPPEVLQYFEEVFHWESNWQAYEASIEPVYFEHIFNLINYDPANKNHKSKAGFMSRFLAFGVDVGVAYFSTMILANIFNLHDYAELVWFSCFGLNLMVGQMSSKHQSIGQKAHDIQVYDHYLNRPSKSKILIRTLLFLMSLTCVYYMGAMDFESILFFLMAMIMILMNVYALGVKKQWFHEWLSNTILIK